MKMKRRLKINVKGKKLYKFINVLHDSGVSCRQQYCKGDIFRGDILHRDLKTVSALAEECGVELKAAEYESLGAKLFLYRKRLGLLLGGIAAAAAVLWSSQTIAVIDIQGNSAVSDEVILAALDELDVRRGTPFRRINYISCENNLQMMVEGLSWAGMHRTGHRLVVEVTEVIEKPEMRRSRIPCNLVAAHEAEIVGVSVLDGQLMHKVGDYVMRGDMLVSGVTGDDTGHTTLHHALGTVTGIYREEAVFTGTFEQERLVPTGRTDTRRRLRLFSLDIPLYLGKNGYELRGEECAVKPLRAFGKTLPISVARYRYSELERSATELTREELTDELMQRVYLYEKNFLGDCEVLGRDITPTEADGTLTLTVTYRLKGDICEQREILIK